MTSSRVPSFLPSLPIREHQQRRARFVQRSHEALRTVRCVFEEVVGNQFEIRGGLLGPPEFGSATGLLLGHLLIQAATDGVVRQYLRGVDLGESLLDLADEPVVIVHGSFDGFADQHLGRHASPAGSQCQLALEIGREFHFQRASVLSGDRVSP
jgi:hypothetical protein